MKVLCLGNNTIDTETKTVQLSNGQYNGLLTSVDQVIKDGFYQTSIFDMSRAEILEVAKQFDEVMVLDQPKSSYNHLDSFYLTIDLGKKLSAKFLDESLKTDIAFFEKLVQDNPSFCIFPFIEVLVNNEYTNVCCRSLTPVSKIENLDFVNDSNYQQIRQDMLNGKLLPEHCSSCYKLEALGIKSARQQETVEWANRLNLESIDDLKRIVDPAYYEVRASNICNLQCRTCGPLSSSQLEKEYKVIKLIPTDYKGWDRTNFNFINFSGLKKMYVTGGEPTAMTEFYEFLDKCIETKNTDFELLINTNVVKLSDKLKTQVDKFSNLTFIVSIDAIGDKNRYIRWPLDWETLVRNMDWIASSKHQMSFNVTVSIYNIFSLYNTLMFLENRYPKSLIHCELAKSPDNIFMPFNAVGVDISMLEDIKSLRCYTNTDLMKTFVDGLIDKFHNNSLDVEQLDKFFKFNDKLDASRNVKLADYIPELEALRRLV